MRRLGQWSPQKEGFRVPGAGFRGFGGARLKNRGVWQDTRHQNCFGIKYDKIELRALFSVFSSLV